MTDPVALAAAFLHTPENSRLIEIGESVVTLSVRGTECRLPNLPGSALRVLVHPSDPGTPLAGWAVDERDLAPVPAVLLVGENGAMIPAQRIARPDIRATQGLDHDMTGFALHRPEGEVVTLLFLLRDGAVTKRVAL